MAESVGAFEHGADSSEGASLVVGESEVLGFLRDRAVSVARVLGEGTARWVGLAEIWEGDGPSHCNGELLGDADIEDARVCRLALKSALASLASFSQDGDRDHLLCVSGELGTFSEEIRFSLGGEGLRELAERCRRQVDALVEVSGWSGRSFCGEIEESS